MSRSNGWYFPEYDPIMYGSIDGTDLEAHDHGLKRALKSKFHPETDFLIEGDPLKTLFVSNLNEQTTNDTLRVHFNRFANVEKCRVIRDLITGFPRGYGFVTFEKSASLSDIFTYANDTILDGNKIHIDFERGRIMKGWKPRRLGGGLGGKRESGQIRFGSRFKGFRYTFDVDRFGKEKFKNNNYNTNEQNKNTNNYPINTNNNYNKNESYVSEKNYSNYQMNSDTNNYNNHKNQNDDLTSRYSQSQNSNNTKNTYNYENKTSEYTQSSNKSNDRNYRSSRSRSRSRGHSRNHSGGHSRNHSRNRNHNYDRNNDRYKHTHRSKDNYNNH